MKTTEQFIEEAAEKHNGVYDYSKTVYTGSRNKVKIICHKKFENGKEHGEFEQEANSHLKGCGCPHCNGTFLKSTEKFIRDSKKIFGEAYDYSKTKYINNHTKVCITCKKHGDFYVIPNNHLHGSGCQKCSKLKRYSKDEYIIEAKNTHGDLYDYSKTDFKNARTKVIVTCKKHGDFEIFPSKHIRGKGCPICSKEKMMGNVYDFIKKANELHGFKYNYEKVIYSGSKQKVEIVCPIHGSFFMTPNSHLNGQGCPKCGDENMARKRRIGKETAIKRFNKIYKCKYDYSRWKEDYKNIDEKIPIICSKHGLFYKTIHAHLQGQGCPRCKTSALENKIRDFLGKNKILFEEQKKFDWLKYNEKGNLRLDFYLPDYNVAIECQGEQHYRPIDLFGGDKAFKYQVFRDNVKYKKCCENGVKIVYFSDKKYDENIITNKNELLKKIKKK